MSGPWEQFQSQGRAVDSGPWTQFAQTKPLEITVTRDAPKDFGIDFSKPVEEVRAAIGKLPAEQRKPALKLWAENYVSNEQRTGKGFENVVRTLARGTPIGSWLDELSAGTVGIANTISGGAIGSPYDENLAYYRARDRQFDKENPKTSIGLQLGGAVASAPFSPALRVAQGAGKLAQAANAGATGLAYGTVYGAGLGEDVQDRATQAAQGGLLGLGLGALAPSVARGVSNTAQYVRDKVRPIPQELSGYSRPAIDRVARAAEADNVITPGVVPPPPGTPYGDKAYAVQRKALGPEGMLADMGDNLQMQTKGIATQPGRGQTVLKTALDERAYGARDRIVGDTDAVLGPARNLVQAEAQAVSDSKLLAKPYYDAFYATPIKPTEALMTTLRQVPKPAWARAKQLAEMEGIDLAQVINTGRGIDLIKRGVDDIASAAEQGSNLQRVAGNLARAIRDETDNILSPGNPENSPWAIARKTAMDGFQFKDGLEEGRKAFSRNTHPDQMRADLNGMSGQERMAFNMGARGQIRDIMGSATSATSAPSEGVAAASAARRQLGSEFAREKIGLVADYNPNTPPPLPGSPGRQSSGTLTRRLDAETTFAGTRNAAYGGSQTAANIAAQKEFPSGVAREAIASDWGNKGIGGKAMEGIYRMTNMAFGKSMDRRRAKIAADAAQMLAAQGGSRDDIANALMSYGTSRMSQQSIERINKIAEILINSTRAPAMSSADRNGRARP